MEKRPALGKGLSALIPAAAEALTHSPRATLDRAGHVRDHGNYDATPIFQHGSWGSVLRRFWGDDGADVEKIGVGARDMRTIANSTEFAARLPITCCDAKTEPCTSPATSQTSQRAPRAAPLSSFPASGMAPQAGCG